MIVDGRAIHENLVERADVCVVGSGAGGAVVARELGEAGRRVVLLEAGELHDPATFTNREVDMFPRLFWESGARSTEDGAIVVYQGRGVGGSTVHNQCYAVRPAESVLATWADRFGLGEVVESLPAALDRVEAMLGVCRPAEAELNGLNRLVRRGAEALGWRGVVQPHNRISCPDCTAACVLGCPYSRPGRGKQSMAVTYIPRALAAGVLLFTNCPAGQVLLEGGRVAGVLARALDAAGRPGPLVTVRAPIVVLAAGAVNSAALWRGSRLSGPDSIAGRTLHLDPATFVAGLFDEPVDAYEGIPQSYYVTEFRDQKDGGDGGYGIVPIFGPPAMVATILGGVGPAHRQLMAEYRRMAAVAVVLRDESTGEVLPGPDRPRIRYRLNEADRRLLVDGMLRAGELLFAAGAREVVIPYAEPVRIGRQANLRAIARRGVVPNDLLLASAHPQGTLRMAARREQGPVDVRGQSHTVAGLYVADASLFPTALGGPPMLATAALADLVARSILKA